MKLVLHHLRKSRSHRILWLLEELGLPYTLQSYDRGRDFRAPASLRAIHPLGKSPVLTIDGTAYAETGAIIETVLDRFGEGRLRPAEGPDADRFRYFLHYAEGSLMPPILVRLITSKLGEPFLVGLIGKLVAKGIDGAFTNGELSSHGAFLEQHLDAYPWFAGASFSAADIQMSFPVGGLLLTGADLPKCRAYLDRITARPAYQRALEAGGEPF